MGKFIIYPYNFSFLQVWLYPCTLQLVFSTSSTLLRQEQFCAGAPSLVLTQQELSSRGRARPLRFPVPGPNNSSPRWRPQGQASSRSAAPTCPCSRQQCGPSLISGTYPGRKGVLNTWMPNPRACPGVEKGNKTKMKKKQPKTKTREKQKNPHQAWILHVTSGLLTNFSNKFSEEAAKLQHWRDCAAACSWLISLADFQRNNWEDLLSTQIQPCRSVCRTHAVLLFICLTAYALVLDEAYSPISFRLSGVLVIGRILCKLHSPGCVIMAVKQSSSSSRDVTPFFPNTAVLLKIRYGNLIYREYYPKFHLSSKLIQFSAASGPFRTTASLLIIITARGRG